MSENYDRDQEQLTNAAAHIIQTSVAVGTQLWMARQKPLKVQIKTATQDAHDARKAIEQGTPKQKILESICKGEVYQRVKKAGGDPDKYAQMILQRAEIDRAVEIMPTKTAAPAKTPKKIL